MPKKDLNQLAKSIVDQAVGDAPKFMTAKREASRKGGQIGGKKRMASMTDEQRTALAMKGVAARKKAPAGKAGAGLVKK
ncbi:hypothetical protein [uncultured Methylibium sp.]|uniref:hypothetical protein n=1 Tax=uncultured Methylibium sp. TaxID=381093 RepID=UPI0025EE37F3|nr:hypothetical protein [uncultured Methylibium sp.]